MCLAAGRRLHLALLSIGHARTLRLPACLEIGLAYAFLYVYIHIPSNLLSSATRSGRHWLLGNYHSSYIACVTRLYCDDCGLFEHIELPRSHPPPYPSQPTSQPCPSGVDRPLQAPCDQIQPLQQTPIWLAWATSQSCLVICPCCRSLAYHLPSWLCHTVFRRPCTLL